MSAHGEPTAMDVTYSLERVDYVQFNQFLLRRVPALRVQVIIRFLAIPLIIGLELGFMHVASVIVVLLLLMGSALWIAFLVVLQRRGIARAASLRPGALGLHTMRLSAEGFQEKGPVLLVSVSWDKITDVLQSPAHLLLMLNAQYGFMIPRRAFSSPDQAQVFLETSRAYRQAALDGTQPQLPQEVAAWPPAPKITL